MEEAQSPFYLKLDFPVNSELLAIPVSSTVVDLQKGEHL